MPYYYSPCPITTVSACRDTNSQKSVPYYYIDLIRSLCPDLRDSFICFLTSQRDSRVCDVLSKLLIYYIYKKVTISWLSRIWRHSGTGSPLIFYTYTYTHTHVHIGAFAGVAAQPHTACLPRFRRAAHPRAHLPLTQGRGAVGYRHRFWKVLFLVGTGMYLGIGCRM